MADPSYILAVDIGTSSTKAVPVEPDGTTHRLAKSGYRLDTPDPVRAEQDPDRILAAVRRTIEQSVQSLGRPRAISFGCAMHTLIGVDAAGKPVTPCITWADRRAQEQAKRLHRDATATELHARTGMPVHALTPLCKLMWMREHDRATFARAKRFLSIKEYVLERLCGCNVVDYAVAGATGLLDVHTLDWDDRALALAGLGHARLSRPVPTTSILDGEIAGAPVVLGATDGVLANLGVGATSPGLVAVSLGTSGAVRATVDRVTIDAAARLFCFVLDEARWVIGGAINNSGLVLRWIRDRFVTETHGTGRAYSGLMSLAALAPPGANGLLFLPFLAGERFARWRPDSCGVYAGLTTRHGTEHLVRAALEGILLCVRTVHDALEEAAGPTAEVRIGGGFAHTPFVRQMLADVLGRRVTMPSTEQASALGSAWLGLQALGESGPPRVPVSVTHEPCSATHEVYDDAHALHERVYDGIEPMLGQLSERRERQ